MPLWAYLHHGWSWQTLLLVLHVIFGALQELLGIVDPQFAGDQFRQQGVAELGESLGLALIVGDSAEGRFRLVIEGTQDVRSWQQHFHLCDLRGLCSLPASGGSSNMP